MDSVLFSSKCEAWDTPQDFYNKLNDEFHFTLDPCAADFSAKCLKYYTKEEDGLVQDWSHDVVFCNPPYGRETIKWVKKAHSEWKKGATVVMLLFARTDTVWFHDYVYGQAEIRFIRGRLKFGDGKNSAPAPSMVVVFNNPLHS